MMAQSAMPGIGHVCLGGIHPCVQVDIVRHGTAELGDAAFGMMQGMSHLNTP